MANTTLFSGAQFHLPPTKTKTVARNSLFTQQPIVSFGVVTSRPNCAKSLKLGKNFSNVCLYRTSEKSSRTGSFVVRCEASNGRVLSESAGSMLGRDLEALIQRARDYKKEYGGSFASVERLVLGFAQDKRFGKQMFNDFRISEKTLRSAIQAVRGHQSVIDQGEIPLSGDEEEEPLWDSWTFGQDMDCDVGSSHIPPMVSNLGEGKLYYLEERDEEALSKRVLALSRTNRKKSALTLFRSMEFAGIQPNLHACNSLLSCLSRNSMLDDLLKVFAYMKRTKIVSGHSCSLVLKALANHRGSDAALRMFSVWQGESEMEQHFDVIVYNTMISICGKANRWVEMEKIWTAMKESGNIGTAVTYRVLVCTFVRCGQYEIAIDAYTEMLRDGVIPSSDAMQAVIGACMKEEKWDLALSVFHSMLKCGLKPNLIACNALIGSLGKVGKVREAFKVYKHIRSLGHTPDSYTWNALLGAFYRANQYANALQLFESLQKDQSFEPNLPMYNTALMCCERLGFWEKALQFLWKLEKSGMSVPTTSYNIVISACEVARKPKVALQIYEHMVQLNCTPDTFTHLSLIRSCIWGDLWSEVEDVLKESTPNVSLYNAAIHGMCLRGRIESAKKLYMKMRDSNLTPDGKTRAMMLQYMKKR